MKCLCCGKELNERGPSEDHAYGWHRHCIKAFFGTDKLPELDVSKDSITTLVKSYTDKGFTVPGVQKKLSLHLSAPSSHAVPRLILVGYPAGYILKPQTEEYPFLPEAEHIVMSMARICGIKTVPFGLIKVNGGAEYAYITKRIDRIKSADHSGYARRPMEDFCQLDGRLTEEKYKGSYERCAKIISQYSSMPGIDLAEFYIRVVFSFIVGNSDMHLKNFSLVGVEPGSREYTLSPAYDMLPVNVIMPEDTEQTALTLNRKKRNLSRRDFLALGDRCNIEARTAERLVDRLIANHSKLIALCQHSLLPESLKNDLEGLIIKRCEELS